MTRDEHIKWCKERAIQEFDYYQKTSGTKDAIQNGCTSMASDIGKHEETRSKSLQSLCIMQAMLIKSRQEFVNFINGFN